MSRGYVLLPGAGLADWVWSRVVPLLDAPAVTARRLEDESPHARLEASFTDLVEYARRVVEETGWDEVVLVGHSGAGLIAAAVTQRCPQVRHLVFVAANIPAHGQGALSAFPPEVQERQVQAMRTQAHSPSLPMRAMEGLVRGHLAHLCTEDTIRYILDQEFHPEPPCVLTATMDWEGFPATPRTYIVCEHDKTLSVGQQKAQAGHLGIEDLRFLPSDHLPMLSCPELLAEILLSLRGRG